MKTNPNDQAYPAHPAVEKQLSLTKLEAFTMAAIQGLCANAYIAEKSFIYKDIAKVSVAIAKSTIEALNKEQGK